MKIYRLSILLFALALLSSNVVNAQISKVKRADKKFKKESYVDAIKIYEKAVMKKDTDKHILEKLADGYRLINESKKSEKWYRKLISKRNLDPIAYYNFSEILKNNGKYEEADIWMREYYRYKSNDSRVLKFKNNKNYLKEILKDSALFEIKRLTINSRKSDFGPAFYGDSLVFSTARNEDKSVKRKFKRIDEPFLDLYYSVPGSTGKFRKAKLFSMELTTNYHEGPVCFVNNNKTVFFTRNNYLERGIEHERVNRLKIYKAEIVNRKWTTVKVLSFNNDEYSCGHPTLTPDGNTLYFVSDMPGGIGGTDIYICKLKNGEFGDPKNLGKTINTEGNEMFPFIHPDGTLYFSSDGYPGLGGLDIYSCDKNGNVYTKPENIGYPLNSSKDDFGLILHNNKMHGYFSSERTGNDDIYQFTIYPRPPIAVNDSTSVNKNHSVKITPIINDIPGDNEELYISDFSKESVNGANIEFEEGEMTYHAAKDFVGLDTLEYTISDNNPVYKGTDKGLIIVNVIDTYWGIEGIVVMKNSGEPVPGVKVRLISKNNDLLHKDLTNKEGKFNYELEEESDYVLKLNKKGYLAKTIQVTTKGMPQGVKKVKEVIEIVKLIKGLKFSVNIYFDTGKANIRSDAAKELDKKLIKLLIDNPTITIELGAHTDSRGNAKSNERLSQRRANSSINYLIKKGIDPKRLIAKGYGESRLLNKCKDGVKCNEVEHQANRRVEIEILSQ